MRRNELRVRETLDDVDRLHASVDAWLDARRHPQYRSQLTALGDVVTGTLAWVREQIARLPTDGDSGAVYEQCRVADQRATFVSRLWSWYRDKFDQRQDRGRLGEALAAADEVVWSCYAQGFDGAGAPRGPVPLPYVEPLFSALVTPRVEPPRDLQARGDELLWQHLSQLPVPAIGLPPACLDRPWMLIFLVHETGHHLQYDLAAGLTKSFRQQLGALATAAGGTPEQVKEWKSWSNEIFADVFALLAAGGEVARGLDELQLTGPVGTVTSQHGYPPPIVRAALGSAVLEFAADTARPLAEDSSRLAALYALALTAKEESLRTQAAGHLQLLPRLVPDLVDAAVPRPDGDEPLPNLRTISGWNSTYFERDGDVQIWCERLLGTGPAVAARSRPAARLCVAGAVAAWSTLERIEDAKLELEEERLRGRILAQLKLCHEEGDRAGPAAPHRVPDLRDDLIMTLRSTDAGALV